MHGSSSSHSPNRSYFTVPVTAKCSTGRNTSECAGQEQPLESKYNTANDHHADCTRSPSQHTTRSALRVLIHNSRLTRPYKAVWYVTTRVCQNPQLTCPIAFPSSASTRRGSRSFSVVPCPSAPSFPPPHVYIFPLSRTYIKTSKTRPKTSLELHDAEATVRTRYGCAVKGTTCNGGDGRVLHFQESGDKLTFHSAQPHLSELGPPPREDTSGYGRTSTRNRWNSERGGPYS